MYLYDNTTTESHLLSSLPIINNQIQINTIDLICEKMNVTEMCNREAENVCDKPMMDYDWHIARGDVIITNVWEKNQNNNVIEHEVVIVGKTTLQDGDRYIFRDSSDGKLYDGTRDIFGSDMEIAVCGLNQSPE